jgi:DNA-binding NtrC family response regulator
MLSAPPVNVSVDAPLNLHQTERRTVLTALQEAKGNKVHAARALGISRRALYRLIAKYDLDSLPGEGRAP